MPGVPPDWITWCRENRSVRNCPHPDSTEDRSRGDLTMAPRPPPTPSHRDTACPPSPAGQSVLHLRRVKHTQSAPRTSCTTRQGPWLRGARGVCPRPPPPRLRPARDPIPRPRVPGSPAGTRHVPALTRGPSLPQPAPPLSPPAAALPPPPLAPPPSPPAPGAPRPPPHPLPCPPSPAAGPGGLRLRRSSRS